MRKVIKGGDVNFSSYPDTFSSSEGQVPGIGSAGIKNNAMAAAAGKFSQNGGYYSFGQPIGQYTNSGSGSGEIIVNKEAATIRPMNNFSKKFSGLSGGRRHRNKQIGCRMTKKGGKKYRKSTNRRKASKRSQASKHKRASKRSQASKHKRGSKHKRTIRQYRSLRIKRGGAGGQPYSNTPISFSQTFNKHLTANESMLANPTPLSPVSNCPYN